MSKLIDVIVSVISLPLRTIRSVGLQKTLFWIFLFITAILLSGSVARWLAQNVTPWFSFFNDLLLQHPWFNISVAALLALYGGWTIYRQDKSDVKPSNVLLLIFLSIVLWKQGALIFNVCIVEEGFSYAHLLSIMMIADLLVLLINYISCENKRVKPDSSDEKKLTFITETDYGSLVDVKWASFADMLTTFINNHPARSKVLSLGVNGVWGKGKSTFLKILADRLEKSELKVIEFNPWICKNEEQITQEFFTTLSAHFKRDRSFDIARSLTRYANTLLSFNASDNVSKLIDLISLGNDSVSLKEQKSAIDNKLNKLDRPIVIIIDDLDRMRCDEILTVFKLIRLTASFNNIVFITAYDRSHLTKQLGEEKLTDAISYLDKIFHAELELPEYESETCVNFLKGILAGIISENRFRDLERGAFNLRNHDLIRAVLPTFRDANRFVNKFALKLHVMKESGVYKELNINDIFMYTLLEYRDAPLLGKIIASPHDYLVTHSQLLSDFKAYSVGNNKDSREQMAKIKETNDVVFRILSEMFPASPPQSRRMCLTTEFMKYVLMRAEGNNLTGKEYMMILGDDNVKETLKNFTGRSLNSLIIWIRHTQPAKLTKEQLKRFADMLIEMIHYTNLGFDSKYIAKALEKCNVVFADDDRNKLSDKLQQSIRSAIESGTCSHYSIAVLLETLNDDERCQRKRLYDDPDVKASGEFGWGELIYKSLFCLNFEKFIQRNPDIKPEDFVRGNSVVKQIIRRSTIYEEDEYDNIEYFDRQLIAESLQKYWSETSPETVEKIKNMIRPMDEDNDPMEVESELGTIFGNIRGTVDFPPHVNPVKK